MIEKIKQIVSTYEIKVGKKTKLLTVVFPFYDANAKKQRVTGDIFVADVERADELLNNKRKIVKEVEL